MMLLNVTRYALVLALWLGMPALSYATKPCGDDTWYTNPDRTDEEWFGRAGLVLTGTVEARDEHIVPYPGCVMDDPSECDTLDESVVSVKILSWEKGYTPDLDIVKLSAAYCSQDPPKVIGQKVRFYIAEASEDPASMRYIFYTPVKE